MKYVEGTCVTNDYIMDCAISWIIQYVIRLPDLDICPGEGVAMF